ncbi:hypothetical protein GCM10009641_41880 [Mycobacterium cookii]|uniref:Uncharacterized protein n=1 Tax=Mycobacterium cookii TaxID=1775 RepID=A0A7I7KY73_9MYCO|nr:hypothetical protein [Mycobacterium cookii]MCV7330746.1 hypothetical protein [Mycobacterium cookii]BBX46659.1 hypothetical protein MCOO_26740 [Mycobacterium cookii]
MVTVALGTAAGAFLAAGLIPLAAAGSARADADDVSPAVDTDFISATDKLFALFGINDVGFADPDDNFEAMVLNIPSLHITDVLTSGADPSDSLAAFGVPDDIAVGTAGVTVNTFTDSMDPLLNSTFTIPFTDPLAGLWDLLVAHDFFGL